MTTLPKRIRVSGLPLLHMGWNTVLVKTESETPEYIMAPYALFGVLPIMPVKIFKSEQGKWYLDYWGMGSIHGAIYSNEYPSPTPIGNWMMGGSHILTVSDADKTSAWYKWPMLASIATGLAIAVGMIMR